MPAKLITLIKLNWLQSFSLGIFLSISFILIINILSATSNESLNSQINDAAPANTAIDESFFSFYGALPKAEIIVSNGSSIAPILKIECTALKAIQVGAFQDISDAQNMASRLSTLGLDAQIQSALITNNTIYRVRVGPFTNNEVLNLTKRTLESAGIYSIVITL